MSNLLTKFEAPVFYTLSFVWVGVVATYVGISLMLITNSLY
ncbi:hypothetical protein [Sulfurimonas sp.]|jgi:hypothetical protein|nr:hypothetical protein [Sulfurimonas sp.]MDY0123783.1 hypothetical protein [Sulfurimonas sp.]